MSVLHGHVRGETEVAVDQAHPAGPHQVPLVDVQVVVAVVVSAVLSILAHHRARIVVVC